MIIDLSTSAFRHKMSRLPDTIVSVVKAHTVLGRQDDPQLSSLVFIVCQVPFAQAG